MRIVFCDDDPVMLKKMQKMVDEFFTGFPGNSPEYGIYSSGEDLLEKETCVDIAFLDVELLGRSGLYIGADLKQANPLVKLFIITSYPDYLDEALEKQVYRFLTKPVDKGRLFRNLKMAVQQYNMDTVEILIETKDGAIRARSHQIISVVADGHLITVQTTFGTYETITSIKEWTAKLSLPCFFSPYRGSIVNMAYITRYEKDRLWVQVGTQEMEMYLSRRNYGQFKKTFMYYLSGVK